MGGQKSKDVNYLDPEQFQDLTAQVKPNKLYGEPKVYKQKQSGNMISVNHYNFADATDFGQAELEAKRVIELSHDSLIKLLSVGVDKNDQFCGQSYDLQVIFEYLDNNLRADILERQKRNISYDESELWHILVSIIAALALLKSRGFSHQDIRPSSILINSENKVKIFPALTFQKNYNSYMEHLLDISTPESFYLSPAQLEALKTKQQKPTHIPSKTDIYNLAVTTIEAALLEKQDNFYDMTNHVIVYQNIENSMQRLRLKYSQTLHDFIQKMLTYNEDQRVDVDQLFSDIENLCSKNHLAVADRLFTLQQPIEEVKKNIEPITHSPQEVSIEKQEIVKVVQQEAPKEIVNQVVQTTVIPQYESIPIDLTIARPFTNFSLDEIDELIRSSRALLLQNSQHQKETTQDFQLKIQYLSKIPASNIQISTVSSRSPQVSTSQYRILNTVTQPIQTIEKVVKNETVQIAENNYARNSQIKSTTTPPRTSTVIHTQTVKIVPQTSQVLGTRQSGINVFPSRTVTLAQESSQTKASGINVLPQRTVTLTQEPSQVQTVYTSNNQPLIVSLPNNTVQTVTNVMQSNTPVRTSQLVNQVRTSQISKLVQIQ